MDNQVDISVATWRDLNALRYVERVCFPMDAWPLWDLIGVLTFPNVVRLKATNSEKMVAFVAADVKRNEDLAWIATFAVLPEYRRQGIGRRLLAECEQALNVSKVKLCVRVTNEAAIRLYEQTGYVRSGYWKRYYADGEDALVFEKRLR